MIRTVNRSRVLLFLLLWSCFLVSNALFKDKAVVETGSETKAAVSTAYTNTRNKPTEATPKAEDESEPASSKPAPSAGAKEDEDEDEPDVEESDDENDAAPAPQQPQQQQQQQQQQKQSQAQGQTQGQAKSKPQPQQKAAPGQKPAPNASAGPAKSAPATQSKANAETTTGPNPRTPSFRGPSGTVTRDAVAYPDVFSIGAQKCGTQTLSNVLVKHPGVCDEGAKEKHFYSEHDYAAHFDEYRAQFQGTIRRRRPHPSLVCAACTSNTDHTFSLSLSLFSRTQTARRTS